jgi:hypothetical protein
VKGTPMLLDAATHQTPHVSFFRRRMERLAGTAALTEWAVSELNARGYFGAYGAGASVAAPTPGVSVEELLVLLAMPHAEADGRLFKLIVRTVQRGPVDVSRLARLARQEHAEALLAWLLRNLPESEHTPATRELADRLHPRGRLDVSYRYDFERLVRRPATKEQLWRRPRG